MRIIDGYEKTKKLRDVRTFDRAIWEECVRKIHPGLLSLIEEDAKDTLNVGYTLENDYLPILNDVLSDGEGLSRAHSAFIKAVSGLEERVLHVFGRCPDVTVIFYFGMLNGAGWATKLDGESVILLGMEKIAELRWYDGDSMNGLILHELGHSYQDQFGTIKRYAKSSREEMIWQLFTEGIAMVFEQEIIGSEEYYHQDQDGWKKWCDENLKTLKQDFKEDLSRMTKNNQRYFGDWVRYQGKGDTGYYLGARFIRDALQDHSFDELIQMDIPEAEALFERFTNR